jgi:hypothetical protein
MIKIWKKIKHMNIFLIQSFKKIINKTQMINKFYTTNSRVI